MPYQSLQDLPTRIQNNLPRHDQEIYKSSFNYAAQEYGEDSRAYATAWDAVKHKYEKDENGRWVKKRGYY